MSSQTEPPVTGRTPLRMELQREQGFDLHAEYFSVRTGGDFFDAFNLSTYVIFLLTDIAGTKEATQPIAAAVQETFRRRGREIFGTQDTNIMDATAQLAQEINHELLRASHGVRFAPTFIGCYDLSLGVLAYINAGGLTAVFRDSENTRILTNVGVPMGLFTHLTYEPSMQAFELGAKLLLVTKGIVETQRGRTNFGVERLIPVIQSSTTNSAKEVCRAVLETAYGFKQVPWYRIQSGLFGNKDADEDLTAMVVVRVSA